MKARLAVSTVGLISAAVLFSACGSTEAAPVVGWSDPARPTQPSEQAVNPSSSPSVTARPGYGEVIIIDEESGEQKTSPNLSREQLAEQSQAIDSAATQTSAPIPPEYRAPELDLPSIPGLASAGSFTGTEVGAAASFVKSIHFSVVFDASTLRAGQSINMGKFGAYFSPSGSASMGRLVSPTSTIDRVDDARAFTATSACVADWKVNGKSFGAPDEGSLGYCFTQPEGPQPTFDVLTSFSSAPDSLVLKVKTTKPIYWLSGEMVTLTATSAWVLSFNSSTGNWLIDSVSAANSEVSVS